MKEQGQLTAFDVRGSERMQEQEFQFCHVMGQASYVADAFLQFVLEEPRLAPSAEALEEQVLEEIGCLERLSPRFWQRFSSSVSLQPWQVRNMVVWGALVSYFYLQHRVFTVLMDWPWILCQGDVHEQLRQLGSMESPPSEPVASRVWCLLQAGMSKAQLAGAIQLLGFRVFGAPRFAVQRSQNAYFKGFCGLWTGNRGAPKMRKPTTTVPNPPFSAV